MSIFNLIVEGPPPKPTPENLRYKTAKAYIDANISVIPIPIFQRNTRFDGKTPEIYWGCFESRLATDEELKEWFADDASVKGIATICGAVSDHMELIDFDYECERIFPDWKETVDSMLSDVFSRCHVSKSPRGYHVRYRCKDMTIPGNDKLAKSADGKETFIETRGEGGYALAPGTPPECHKLGIDYHDISDRPMHVVLKETITVEERAVLIDTAKSYNLYAKNEEEKEAPPKHTSSQNGNPSNASIFKQKAVGSTVPDRNRPGDDFNATATWDEVLEPFGWKAVGKRRDGAILWRRPGKDCGSSATSGFCKGELTGDLLHVFSSNAAPLEAEKSYSKFAAYTVLKHKGDFAAATADLGKQGYGEKAKKPDKSPVSANVSETENVTIKASQIKPRAVEWLWYGRIPLRKMTTFAGVGGIGKTFVLCDISARVSRGLEWPDGNGECAREGKVLYISGEDDPEDTLVPRLIECGADLDKISFMRMKAQDHFSLADLPVLDKAISEMGDDVRFVVIDPPSSFMAGVDDHKNAEVRAVLSPLKSWVERNSLALAFNTHLNKGASGKIDAMMRVMGSVAWVNAVRAAHLFAQDSDNPDKVVFVPMKMNLCKKKKGLGYQIAVTEHLAKVEWLGDVDVTANDAINNMTPVKTQRQNAVAWLIDKFNEKPEWPSETLITDGKHYGLSKDSLHRAKGELGIKARRIQSYSGEIFWIWLVDAEWKHLKPKIADF